MRSYCGVYIDAGYLTATASLRLTGTSYRAATEVDVASLVEAVIAQATGHSQLSLLRVHWYDAARGVASSEQRRIATLPRVKLRLGRTSVHGEQKGVDLKLALDLITQARNRVTDVVYLVSGDDDLTEAVEEAQHLGTQVVLLAVPDREGRPINVSRNLQMACDEMLLIDSEELDSHVRKATPKAPAEEAEPARVTPVAEPTAAIEPTAPPRVTPAVLAAMLEHRAPAVVPPRRLYTSAAVPVYSSTTGQSSTRLEPATPEVDEAVSAVVDSLLASWRLSAGSEAKLELLAGKPVIPPELDRTLLRDLSARLHVDELDSSTRFRLRHAFWEKAERP